MLKLRWLKLLLAYQLIPSPYRSVASWFPSVAKGSAVGLVQELSRSALPRKPVQLVWHWRAIKYQHNSINVDSTWTLLANHSCNKAQLMNKTWLLTSMRCRCLPLTVPARVTCKSASTTKIPFRIPSNEKHPVGVESWDLNFQLSDTNTLGENIIFFSTTCIWIHFRPPAAGTSQPHPHRRHRNRVDSQEIYPAMIPECLIKTDKRTDWWWIWLLYYWCYCK